MSKRFDYQGSDDELTKKESIIQQFTSLTPRQIDNYIENNVNNLASAKDVLKTLSKLVLMLYKDSEKQ